MGDGWRCLSGGATGCLIGRATSQLLAASVDLAEQIGVAVDLIDLDAASPVLAMQVLRHGRAVRVNDSRRVAWLTMRVITDYADLRIARAPIEAAMRARLGHG